MFVITLYNKVRLNAIFIKRTHSVLKFRLYYLWSLNIIFLMRQLLTERLNQHFYLNKFMSIDQFVYTYFKYKRPIIHNIAFKYKTKSHI